MGDREMGDEEQRVRGNEREESEDAPASSTETMSVLMIESPKERNSTKTVSRTSSRDSGNGGGGGGDEAAKLNASMLRVGALGALGGLLFGYDLGLISGALQPLTQDLGLTSVGQELVVGMLKLGAALGTFVGGALMFQYGRRITILVCSAFFVVGPTAMALAWHVSLVVIGRIIVGFGVGISSVVVPCYLGEVSSFQFRGFFVSMYEIAIAFGMVAAVLVDVIINAAIGEENDSLRWRLMVGIPILFGVVLLLLTAFLLPESPRWLVMKGRFDEALDVLRRLRDDASTQTRDTDNTKGGCWCVRWRRKRALALDGGDIAMTSTDKKSDDDVEEGSRKKNADAERERTLREDARVKRKSKDENDQLIAEIELELLNIWSNAEKEKAAIEENRTKFLASSPSRTSSSSSMSFLENSKGRSDVASAEAAPMRSTEKENDSDADADAPSQVVTQNREPSFFRTFVTILVDIVAVARSEERFALFVIVVLAIANQFVASTAIINYGTTIMALVGVEGDTDQVGRTAAVAACKMAGIILSAFLVDRVGRRALMLGGSFGMTVGMLMLTAALVISDKNTGAASALTLISLLVFISAFALSWAGIFWVLVSELFSMGSKSSAASLASFSLFLAGAIVNLTFNTIVEGIETYWPLLFAGIALFSFFFILICLPETKQIPLQEVQQLMSARGNDVRDGITAAVCCGKHSTARKRALGGLPQLPLSTSPPHSPRKAGKAEDNADDTAKNV